MALPTFVRNHRDATLRYVVRPLRRCRLLVPTWRLYERIASVTERDRQSVDERGIAIPPPYLRMLVLGLTSGEYFLSSGRDDVNRLRELFADAGLDLDDCDDVLDFGCGCGRVARWWPEKGHTEWHGCDFNPRLVSWSSQNLPHVHASVNPLEPPTPYEDDSFDAIYAISVFTHWPEPLQHAWLRELCRILRPAGRLLFTTHGETMRHALVDSDLERFNRGEFVVRFSEDAGSNLCSAYHPPMWTREKLLAGVNDVLHRPDSFTNQDVWVVRPDKPPHNESTLSLQPLENTADGGSRQKRFE